MRRTFPLLVAALPGVLVVAAAIAGWAPTARDLPTYFVPLRQHTAAVLAGLAAPFWNDQVGCGEPYFANPQTGLAYPPAWAALVLPAGRAIGLEVGFHLALLGVGCFVLARRLGASNWLAAAAGVGSACCGPIVSAAGVLNNLATTAWLPWLWAAALGGSVAGMATAGAAAYLAAEPQLALLGGLVAVAVAPTRRTLAGLLLAGSLVAVQAVPFAFWVAGGDRGPASSAVATAAGGLSTAQLPSLVLPGLAQPTSEHAPFVPSLTLPLWGVLLGAAAVWERRTARARLAIAGWTLVALALVPSLPLGDRVWANLTLGLVRHPARLLFPAAVALTAAAAACRRRLSLSLGAVLCAIFALVGVVSGAEPWQMLVGATGAAAVVGSLVPAAGALLGALVLLPAGVGELSFRFQPSSPVASCLAEQRQAQRIYLVEPTEAQARWAAGGWPARAHDLGWGYTVLLDHRRTARTFAPLQSRSLAFHLAQADRGPAGRWWLNLLGTDVVVSQHSIPGLPQLCSADGLFVLHNPDAAPAAFVAATLPQPNGPLMARGEVLAVSDGPDSVSWTVDVDPGGGVLVRVASPDPGWRFTVDGLRTRVVGGPGILHGVPVAAGRHEVRAVYRPPGLALGAGIAMIGFGVLVGVRWRRW